MNTASPPGSRYGVYYCPEPDTDFWELGSSWLGRNVLSNQELDQPVLKETSINSLYFNTSSPRKYGLHGTLKAPIHLATKVSEADFLHAVQCIAQSTAPFLIPSVKVDELGDFLAIRPTEPCAALCALAEACVRQLDALRQPATAHEIARRNPDALTSSQQDNLMTWGYPYVFDDFRFHITISNSIKHIPMRQALLQDAVDYFAPVCAKPLPISSLCVFTQMKNDAPFILKHRFKLTG